ncbi:MAG: MbnP family protein [Patiriisocius sp.]|uniref:MbnP family protein n=1 Tax=Patiriisocius sp. TaxID=2822396 RepID=UPI003EF24CCC
MKKIAITLFAAVALMACDKDDDNETVTPNVAIDINFSQNFDGTEVTSADFNSLDYTVEHGEMISFSRMRYLITDITFTNADGVSTIVDEYNFVDVGAGMGASIENISLPAGTYTVSARFGFTEEKNTTNAYNDLNAASWNVPEPMGGGYHYMQLEGQYINDIGVTTGYAYHTISAAQDAMTPNVTREDTSIPFSANNIVISNDNDTVDIKMNIAEWFKPWNLNERDGMLMGNYQAQLDMETNGQTVFTIE